MILNLMPRLEPVRDLRSDERDILQSRQLDIGHELRRAREMAAIFLAQDGSPDPTVGMRMLGHVRAVVPGADPATVSA